MAGSIANRLSELGIELPKVAKPLANYLPFVVTGNLVFVSGQLPMWDGELMFTGKLGDNIQIGRWAGCSKVLRPQSDRPG